MFWLLMPCFFPVALPSPVARTHSHWGYEHFSVFLQWKGPATQPSPLPAMAFSYGINNQVNCISSFQAPPPTHCTRRIPKNQTKCESKRTYSTNKQICLQEGEKKKKTNQQSAMFYFLSSRETYLSDLISMFFLTSVMLPIVFLAV